MSFISLPVPVRRLRRRRARPPQRDPACRRSRPIADRDDAADCQGVEVTFVPQATQGSTQGTGVNHIGFSYPDLTAKMEELESIGSRGSGVRLQRFEGGEMIREAPGLFKYGFIFDQCFILNLILHYN